MRLLLDTVTVIRIASDESLLSPTALNSYRDPFDRMLICQAIDEGLSIVTPDAQIRSYPVATIW